MKINVLGIFVIHNNNDSEILKKYKKHIGADWPKAMADVYSAMKKSVFKYRIDSGVIYFAYYYGIFFIGGIIDSIDGGIPSRIEFVRSSKLKMNNKYGQNGQRAWPLIMVQV